MFNRLLENISFGLTSSLAVFFMRKPDVVYVNTWAVFALGLTSVACKLRRLPTVLHIQDMYPESLAVQNRLSRGHWLYRLLLSIDRWIALQARGVIVLADSFAQGFVQDRHIPSPKVHIIPNWEAAGSVSLLSKQHYRQKAGISENAFVLVYGGNIGTAAGLEAVVEAMGKVSTEREVVLVIAGSGSRLEDCQKRAAKIQSGRIIFHSPWLAEQTSEVLAAADVLVLPTLGRQSLASVPSKLLSYLQAARPVLACVLAESDTAQVIEKAGCGWIVPPDLPDPLVRKVEELASLPQQIIDKMGNDGRKYMMENFTTEICLPQVIEVLEQAAGMKS